jgi:hypothetical protein
MFENGDKYCVFLLLGCFTCEKSRKNYEILLDTNKKAVIQSIHLPPGLNSRTAGMAEGANSAEEPERSLKIKGRERRKAADAYEVERPKERLCAARLYI